MTVAITMTATPTLRLSNRSGTTTFHRAQPQQADAQHRHRQRLRGRDDRQRGKPANLQMLDLIKAPAEWRPVREKIEIIHDAACIQHANWKAASGLSLSLLSISVAPRSPGLISNVSVSLSPCLLPCRLIWISNTMSVQVKPGIVILTPLNALKP